MTRVGPLRVIGTVRSPLKSKREAPNFYTEGAPSALLELKPRFLRGLLRASPGDELIVITWLHRARRGSLTTYPEDDRRHRRTGVFLTRSPDRPNPIGLHRCRILQVRQDGVLIDAIEAIDGTPILDIKPVVREANDS